MTNDRVKKLFEEFDTNDSFRVSEPYGGGHINDTYRVVAECGKYILQRINTAIFTDPDGVMSNIYAVTSHIAEKLISEGLDPAKGTLRVVKTKSDGLCLKTDEGAFRLFYFVNGRKPDVSMEAFKSAGEAFGAFGKRLLDFPAETLSVTIPDFHNTPKRYRDLCDAVRADVCGRVSAVEEELSYFRENEDFYSTVRDRLDSGELKLRVTHNDTKLDNVIFDADTGEASCVCDLDTVMPDSILCDYGDAMRAGMNPVCEDEPDVTSLDARLDVFRAFTEGYLHELGEHLTENELSLLHLSPRLLTLECAMRFLTDYLSGDTYFKTSRPSQNLDRARVGIALARSMKEKEPEMARIIDEIISK